MARLPNVSRVCLVAAIVFAASCDRPAVRGGASTRVTAAEETTVQLEAPTLDELGNASYAGIYDEPVQLVDGRYEGEPFVEGGASRPTAGVAPELRLVGDLDGNGVDEAVVLLWTNSGGSGTFNYVAVAGRRGDDVVNLGTAPLGDRVQVRAARVVEGTVELLSLIHI